MKNITPAGTFVCSIEPNKKGQYTWFLNKDGKTYGGTGRTQRECINQAFAPSLKDLLANLSTKTGLII